MKRQSKLWVCLFLLFVALNGCSVDKVEQPVQLVPGDVVISTSYDAARAFSSVLQARDFSLTTTDLYKNLGQYSLDVIASAPTLTAESPDIACVDGGSYKYKGSVSGDAYDLTFTFNGCRDKRFQYAGSYTLTGGTTTDLQIKLGDSSNTFNVFYFNKDYSVLIDYLQAQASFTMSGNGTDTDAFWSITPSGTVKIFDYFLLETFTITYNGYNAGYTITTDPVTLDEVTSITTDGGFREKTVNTSLNIAFSGFTIDRTTHFTGTTPSSDDTSVTGSALFTCTPPSYCYQGEFTIATTMPVTTNYAGDRTTAGILTINNAATATYNSSGDVDVVANNTTPISYVKEHALMEVFNYCALEEHTAPLLGPIGTAIANTMAVTLTWTGPNGVSTSDMDLHVKYYDTTTPDSTTAPAWVIDWHQGKNCTNPPGISFGDALDIDGDHICDVGLDFDDTNGYGPEHITGLDLPTGYYVVSVDSYSLNSDASATLYLAIHLGDNIFGPYSGTLSASDGESGDAASWFRVADVRVNGDGSVDVLAPDQNLTPYDH